VNQRKNKLGIRNPFHPQRYRIEKGREISSDPIKDSVEDIEEEIDNIIIKVTGAIIYKTGGDNMVKEGLAITHSSKKSSIVEKTVIKMMKETIKVGMKVMRGIIANRDDNTIKGISGISINNINIPGDGIINKIGGCINSRG